jgi:uncharacterized membrane protein YcaP (DUF421 family)
MSCEGLQGWLVTIFGGDWPSERLDLHQVAARAIVVYLAGIALVRIGKSRMIGRLTALDVLLGFILGSILSRGITGSASISGTLVASAALVAAHYGLTLAAYRSHALGNAIKGRRHVVVKDGRIEPEAMRRSHLSLADLEEAMRLRGVERIENVKLATKERSGEISVIPRQLQG